MKYMTIVLKLADNADGELVIKAAENIHGSTLSAIAWAHALDERDDLMDAVRAIHDYAHDHSTGPAVPDALWEIRDMAKAVI